MKFTRLLRLFAFSIPIIILSSCDQDSPTPVTESPLIPEEYQEEHYTRTFFHNAGGQLTKVVMVSVLPNGSTMESEHTYTYDAAGKLKESITDTGWRMVYTVTGNVITRTDEYLNESELTQYHTYSYDSQDRLVESVTWQDIPEEGGEIPVSKETYEYDDAGNISYYRLFYFGPNGEGVFPLTVFHYSNYDQHINSERYFSVNPFNPTLLTSKNNPGKMTVENASGVVSSTEVYAYEYHTKGYATKKTADVTLVNGNTGSYTATYKFRD